jgi:hypothetical protein
VARKSAENRHPIDIANSHEVCFGPISVVDGQNPASAITIKRVPFSGVPHRAIRS